MWQQKRRRSESEKKLLFIRSFPYACISKCVAAAMRVNCWACLVIVQSRRSISFFIQRRYSSFVYFPTWHYVYTVRKDSVTIDIVHAAADEFRLCLKLAVFRFFGITPRACEILEFVNFWELHFATLNVNTLLSREKNWPSHSTQYREIALHSSVQENNVKHQSLDNSAMFSIAVAPMLVKQRTLHIQFSHTAGLQPGMVISSKQAQLCRTARFAAPDTLKTSAKFCLVDCLLGTSFRQ